MNLKTYIVYYVDPGSTKMILVRYENCFIHIGSSGELSIVKADEHGIINTVSVYASGQWKQVELVQKENNDTQTGTKTV